LFAEFTLCTSRAKMRLFIRTNEFSNFCWQIWKGRISTNLNSSMSTRW
jgi:hypothetical protein